MKILNRFSNGIKKFANRRYILPVLLLFVLTLIILEKSPFGAERLKELNGGLGMLDMRLHYDAAGAYAMFQQIGAAGRLLYTRLLGFDFLFILVYTVFQTLLITSLMGRVNLGERWQRLNMIPFVRGGLDVAENLLLLYAIGSFPGKTTIVIGVASVVTTVKLIINYGYIAFVFCLGAALTRQSIRSKKSKQKHKESGLAK